MKITKLGVLGFLGMPNSMKTYDKPRNHPKCVKMASLCVTWRVRWVGVWENLWMGVHTHVTPHFLRIDEQNSLNPFSKTFDHITGPLVAKKPRLHKNAKVIIFQIIFRICGKNQCLLVGFLGNGSHISHRKVSRSNPWHLMTPISRCEERRPLSEDL